MNASSPLRFGPVEIRPRERRVLVAGHAAGVGARAFDVLLVLAEQRDRLVTKSELLERVWPDLLVEEANLSVHVAALRKVLGAGAIATIPGRGYRFALSEDAEASAAVRVLPQAAATATAPVTAHAVSPAAADAAPGEIDPLVGREDEVYDIVGLLCEQRLVSIVGAGGIGKTRLARAVLQRLREDFVDGVWWVDLSSAVAAADVTRALARTLGAAPADEDSAAQLAAALAPRSRMLIVLDNCEQVAAEAGTLAVALLAALRPLRLLATSRLALHVAGEQVWRIESLPVPALGATLAEARRCGAFELFERRARAADRRFAIDAARLPLAIEVCRRLEGHPLALEMAAARVPQLGLAALQQRLDERLKLLRASDHIRPDRQASLKSLIDWSWSLLEPPSRAVLRRVAVFAGSFDLAAAQTVAASDEVDAWGALDGLASLVDHSLVQVLASGDGAEPAELRYRLPETVRLYALQRLDEAGEAAAAQRRHRQAMVEAARRIDALRWTAAEGLALARCAADEDDLLLAFDGACANGDAAAAAAIGHALALLNRQRDAPMTRSQGAAARALLAQAAPEAHAAAMLRDLAAAAQTRAADRVADAAQRIEAWQASGDRRGLLEALADLARDFAAVGRGKEARALLGRLQSGLASGDAVAWRLEAAIVEADVRAQAGEGERRGAHPGAGLGAVQAALEAALIDSADAAPPARRMRALLCRAELAMSGERADPREVVAWLERADAASTALQPRCSDTAANTAALWQLRCAASIIAGDADAARSAAVEALPLLLPRQRAATLFDALAWLAGRTGQTALGAQLLEQADRWYHEHRERRQFEARLRDLALQALAGTPSRLLESRAGANQAAAAPPHSSQATAAASDAAQAETSARELLGLDREP